MEINITFPINFKRKGKNYADRLAATFDELQYEGIAKGCFNDFELVVDLILLNAIVFKAIKAAEKTNGGTDNEQ